MEPDQIDRCVDAAKKYINAQMQPADIVALVSLATNMRVDLDFTSDKTKILSVLTAYSSGQGQGFDNGDTGSAEGTAESGGSYTADDTDFNTFSADRKLLALQSTMQALGKITQKKSLIYFSNGISQNGTDNQSALRAATAAAVKNNVSIYPVDIRGLQAFPPGGEAQNASLHGQSAYSGAAVLNDLSGNAASQETLSTLAADTGGKAFFDTNDFGGVFTQVQKDSSAYYVLGFTSTNALKDGHYRRLKVQVNRGDVKLEFRPGYYAGRDYKHLNSADREAQMEDELAAELPQTDVPLYAGTAYFRQDESHYYLAVSLVVPGSQIPFVSEKDKDNATIDIIGEVRIAGSGKVPVGQLARYGETGGGQHAAGAAEECAVQHWVCACSWQLSSEIYCPRESDGAHGIVRNGRANSGFAQSAAADEFGGAEQFASTGYECAEEEGRESADSGPDAAGAECDACVYAGPAFVFAV